MTHPNANDSAPTAWLSRMVTAANAVSLDVVLIGITWQAWASVQLLGVAPRPIQRLILALTIWLIYTMDRWLDARQLKPDRPHTLRHRFHHEHRRGLLWCWIGALVLDAVLVAWQLSSGELRLVVLGTAAVIVYMACVHLFSPRSRFYFAKELAVGPLFAFGVFIPTLVQQPSVASWACWWALSLLYVVNCVLVAQHDRAEDEQQNMKSMVSRRVLSGRMVAGVLASYLAVCFSLAVVAGVPRAFVATLVVATLLMAVVHWVVMRGSVTDASGWYDLAVALAPLVALVVQS